MMVCYKILKLSKTSLEIVRYEKNVPLHISCLHGFNMGNSAAFWTKKKIVHFG